jgi:hypothetical protein
MTKRTSLAYRKKCIILDARCHLKLYLIYLLSRHVAAVWSGSCFRQAKPVGESPFSLLQQVSAALAQSCQPFMAWRLECVSGELDRLWPDGVPQIRNEPGSAYVTGYAHDEAGNLVYLGMVWHKSELESTGLQSRPGKQNDWITSPCTLRPR